MKYLITGGAGFIGIKLVEKLLKNKTNKVYIIDNLSKKTGNKNALNTVSSASALEGLKNFLYSFFILGMSRVSWSIITGESLLAMIFSEW